MVSDYWTERAESLEKEHGKAIDKYYANLQKQYRKASDSIQKDILKWYTRYATENGITLAEAKRILNTTELAEFRWTVEEYIEKAKEGSTWAKELERASTRVHVTRLESLLLQVQQQAEVLAGFELDALDKFLGSMFEDTYYQSVFNIFQDVGIGRSFAQLDRKKIRYALDRPWAVPSANFSQRIWTNKTKLVSTLDTELTQMIITGERPDTVVKRVASTMNTSMNNASRLVQTEEAHISAVSRAETYKELGVKEFQYVCTLDERTCKTCGPMDGLRFKESDRAIGVNCAPLHPWCRCTDIPYYDDMDDGTRTARDGEGKTYRIPSNITYEEWKSGLRVKDGQMIPKEVKAPKTEVKINDNLTETLGKEHTTAMKGYIEKAPDNIKKAWNDRIDDVPVRDAHYKQGAHYHRGSGWDSGVHLDIDISGKDAYYMGTHTVSKEAYHDVFHELGHGFDDVLGDKGDPWTSPSYIFKSSKYKHADSQEGYTLNEMVRKEINDRVDTDWTRLKDEAVAKGEKKSSVRKYDAYQVLKKELRESDPTEFYTVSDMIEGATNGNVKGWGGHGDTYWKESDARVGSEAFAEMFSATIRNGKDLVGIKKYAPKSYEIFLEIIDDIAKRGN